MNWIKFGKIYDAINNSKEIFSHAANPLAVFLGGDTYRIFYSGRNQHNKSSISYVDFDLAKQLIIYDHKEPIFLYGNDESFYSHGVSIGNSYTVKKEQYILFMGWQIRENKHWRGDIGKLRLTNLNELYLDPQFPFITCDQVDEISLSYPWVVFHDNIYKMWYGATISWESENGEMIHAIKYATSTDGENWIKHGIAIPYEIGIAQAFSRPTVLINESGYHMWYSYRSGDGTPYRIGYSHSINGINWTRKHNETGIEVADEGWDSEMICYPFVFQHNKDIYMLYNGNGYGKTGFGLAILEQ